MAPTLAGTDSAATAPDAATFTVPTPGGLSDGDIIILAVTGTFDIGVDRTLDFEPDFTGTPFWDTFDPDPGEGASRAVAWVHTAATSVWPVTYSLASGVADMAWALMIVSDAPYPFNLSGVNIPDGDPLSATSPLGGDPACVRGAAGPLSSPSAPAPWLSFDVDGDPSAPHIADIEVKSEPRVVGMHFDSSSYYRRECTIGGSDFGGWDYIFQVVFADAAAPETPPRMVVGYVEMA